MIDRIQINQEQIRRDGSRNEQRVKPARTRINLSHLEPSNMDIFIEIVARVLVIYLITFGAYVIWSNYLK